MGQYLVTQAQWKAVATLPKLNRDLEPDPSHFKNEVRNQKFYPFVLFPCLSPDNDPNFLG
jgi:formylglycine-generating enzyme required for sulfatase activity